MKNIRTCICCNKKCNKNELIRFTKEDGEILVDLEQKRQARGWYICKDMKCFDKLKNNKRLSLKMELELTDDILESLKKAIES